MRKITVPDDIRVLDALQPLVPDLRLTYETVSIGAGEFQRSGNPLPEAALERLRTFDAILLGAILVMAGILSSLLALRFGAPVFLAGDRAAAALSIEAQVRALSAAPA